MFPGNDRPLSNNMIIAGLVGLLLLLVALGNVFWEEPETEKRFESTRTLMDTYVSVTVYDTDEDRAEAAIDAAFQRMEDIVAIASRFNSSSELSRLNSQGTLTSPSAELVEMIQLSVHYGDVTSGAFDISITPLLNLWNEDHHLFNVSAQYEKDLNAGTFPQDLRDNFTHFQPALYDLNETPLVTMESDLLGTGTAGWTIHSNWQQYYVVNESGTLNLFTKFWYFPCWSQQEHINQTLDVVGYHKITVSSDAITLLPGMSITLDGMAKGYAVDAAIATLKEQGISRAMVNAGGDIATLGTKPDDEDWLIGLQNPENKAESVTEFQLAGQAIATSGNYERYFNKSYEVGHIMDPSTGRDVYKCSSSTIIAENCSVADILATAIFVLGPEQGVALVETLPDVDVLVLDHDDPELFYRSSGLEAYELKQ